MCLARPALAPSRRGRRVPNDRADPVNGPALGACRTFHRGTSGPGTSPQGAYSYRGGAGARPHTTSVSPGPFMRSVGVK